MMIADLGDDARGQHVAAGRCRRIRPGPRPPPGCARRRRIEQADASGRRSSGPSSCSLTDLGRVGMPDREPPKTVKSFAEDIDKTAADGASARSRRRRRGCFCFSMPNSVRAVLDDTCRYSSNEPSIQQRRRCVRAPTACPWRAAPRYGVRLRPDAQLPACARVLPTFCASKSPALVSFRPITRSRLAEESLLVFLHRSHSCKSNTSSTVAILASTP